MFPTQPQSGRGLRAGRCGGFQKASNLGTSCSARTEPIRIAWPKCPAITVYAPDTNLPHRRPVRWLGISISRDSMSIALQNSVGSIGTVSTISKHAAEIERLLGGDTLLGRIIPDAVSIEQTIIEDATAFQLEQYLQKFLIENWEQTLFGAEFSILEENGEQIGDQFRMEEVGRADILAESKDHKRLLVIELKAGRASDKVVGQLLRYMGFVNEHIAEDGQTVEGAIIAFEDDRKLKYALSLVPSISYYRYQMNFKLIKIGGI
jgi:restriction system protein